MTAAATRPTIATPITYRDPLPDAVDVVVIGGGVIGVFTALYLARSGATVLLCEKGRIAGEQSSRNWGWIRQQGRDEGELPIMTQALGLWREIDAELKGATGFAQVGVNYISTTEADMASNEAWMDVAKRHDLDTRLLSKREVSEMFGGASDARWIGGIQTPSDAKGEPWVAVPAVARLAHKAGVLIREDCAVRTLETAAGELTGVVTEAGAVACEQVVLAGGAWSSLFARAHGIEMPQLAVKATVAATAPLPQFFGAAAADEAFAIRRRADGGYSLAASGVHGFALGPDAFRRFFPWLNELKRGWRHIKPALAAPEGFPDAWRTSRKWAADEETPFERTRVLEPAPDAQLVARMTKGFGERFPTIGAPKIASAWAGMIDAMPDIVPIVDRVPALPGLIVATGMSGHGFGIGPGFGRVIARLARGETPEHDLARFRFGRFTDGSPLNPGPAL
ncbi:MAG: FAD-binding oxidoreductase [Pseudomonadota bacterium]